MDWQLNIKEEDVVIDEEETTNPGIGEESWQEFESTETFTEFEKNKIEVIEEEVYVIEGDPFATTDIKSDPLSSFPEDEEETIEDLHEEKEIVNQRSKQNKLKRKRKEGQRFPCPACDITFAYKHSFTHHFQSVHKKLKPYSCTMCESAFSSKGTMLQHIQSFHEKLKPHKCTRCESAFSKKSSVIRHDRLVHQNLKPHSCTMCDKSFALNEDFLKHYRSVHKMCEKLGSYKCAACERTFSQNWVLIRHIQSVHENQTIRYSICS